MREHRAELNKRIRAVEEKLADDPSDHVASAELRELFRKFQESTGEVHPSVNKE